MQSVTSATVVATTARANNITLFASLEVSKSKWVVTSSGLHGKDGLTLRIQTPRSMHNAEMNELDWKHPM